MLGEAIKGTATGRADDSRATSWAVPIEAVGGIRLPAPGGHTETGGVPIGPLSAPPPSQLRISPIPPPSSRFELASTPGDGRAMRIPRPAGGFQPTDPPTGAQATPIPSPGVMFEPGGRPTGGRGMPIPRPSAGFEPLDTPSGGRGVPIPAQLGTVDASLAREVGSPPNIPTAAEDAVSAAGMDGVPIVPLPAPPGSQLRISAIPRPSSRVQRDATPTGGRAKPIPGRSFGIELDDMPSGGRALRIANPAEPGAVHAALGREWTLQALQRSGADLGTPIPGALAGTAFDETLPLELLSFPPPGQAPEALSPPAGLELGPMGVSDGEPLHRLRVDPRDLDGAALYPIDPLQHQGPDAVETVTAPRAIPIPKPENACCDACETGQPCSAKPPSPSPTTVDVQLDSGEPESGRQTENVGLELQAARLDLLPPAIDEVSPHRLRRFDIPPLADRVQPSDLSLERIPGEVPAEGTSLDELLRQPTSTHDRKFPICTQELGVLGHDKTTPVYMLVGSQTESVDRLVSPNSRRVAGEITGRPDVERAIRAAIDAWNDQSQATKRLVYKGSVSAANADAVFRQARYRDAVVVRAAPSNKRCDGGAPACAEQRSCNPQPTLKKWGVCQQCIVNLSLPGLPITTSLLGSTGPLHWTLRPKMHSLYSTPDDLVQALTHELGHCLRISHDDDPTAKTEVCNPPVKAALMNTRVEIGRWDIDAMLTLYGWNDGNLTAFRSSDGRSWYRAVFPPDSKPDTYLGSVSSQPGSDRKLFIAYPYQHRAVMQIYEKGAWSARIRLASGDAGITYHPVAVAVGEPSETVVRGGATGSKPTTKQLEPLVLAAWVGIGKYSGRDGRDIVHYALSYGGRSWKGVATLTGSSGVWATRRQGVAAVYDPSSKAFVVQYLDVDDRIESRVIKPAQTGASRTTYTGAPTARIPAIACQKVRKRSDHNCLMVYSDKQGNRVTVPFRVDDTGRVQYARAQVMRDPKGVPSRPVAVAALESARGSPWLMAQVRPGTSVIDLWHRMDARPATSWQRGPSLATGRTPISPVALGSMGGQFWAFVLSSPDTTLPIWKSPPYAAAKRIFSELSTADAQKCLALGPKGAVELERCDADNDQRWHAIPIPLGKLRGLHAIRSKANRQCVGVIRRGRQLTVAPCTLMATFLFRFVPQPDGSFVIKPQTTRQKLVSDQLHTTREALCLSVLPDGRIAEELCDFPLLRIYPQARHKWRVEVGGCDPGSGWKNCACNTVFTSC